MSGVAGRAGAQPAPPLDRSFDRSAAIARVVHLVNENRFTSGLGPLRPEPLLADTAQRWADRLAASGELSHDPDLERVPTDWRKLGENVGYGPDPDAIHAAFLASPAHAANVLDPDIDRIGVGVTVVGDRVYVVQRFEDVAPPRPAIVHRVRSAATQRKS